MSVPSLRDSVCWMKPTPSTSVLGFPMPFQTELRSGRRNSGTTGALLLHDGRLLRM
jgi:hypothetical protein